MVNGIGNTGTDSPTVAEGGIVASSMELNPRISRIFFRPLKVIRTDKANGKFSVEAWVPGP